MNQKEVEIMMKWLEESPSLDTEFFRKTALEYIRELKMNIDVYRRAIEILEDSNGIHGLSPITTAMLTISRIQEMKGELGLKVFKIEYEIPPTRAIHWFQVEAVDKELAISAFHKNVEGGVIRKIEEDTDAKDSSKFIN